MSIPDRRTGPKHQHVLAGVLDEDLAEVRLREGGPEDRQDPAHGCLPLLLDPVIISGK